MVEAESPKRRKNKTINIDECETKFEPEIEQNCVESTTSEKGAKQEATAEE